MIYCSMLHQLSMNPAGTQQPFQEYQEVQPEGLQALQLQLSENIKNNSLRPSAPPS